MDEFMLMMLAMEDAEMDARDELEGLDFDDNEDLCGDLDDCYDYLDFDMEEEEEN